MGIYQNSSGTIIVDHYKRKGFYTMQEHHAHSEYELYYLFNGERDFFIRDRCYRIERGSFVLVEKEELHKTIDTSVPDHERVVIYFCPSILANFTVLGKSGVIILPPQEHFKGENLVREIIHEAQQNEAGRDLMLESMLKQLLILLFRSQHESPEIELEHTAVHQTISKIAAYVSTNYKQPLRLNDVAATFFISPFYLSRKFKQCTGFGFSEYVQLVRIREAQRLLRDTELKMNDIAENIGIESVANFYKLFKSTNDCSPLQYRKRQQRLIQKNLHG